MNIWEIVLLSLGLAMDAFAVSITKGLAIGKIRVKDCLTAGLYFGVFQALMPIAGFYLGSSFSKYISAYDHWIAFILLAIIGINMIVESFKKDPADDKNASMGFKAMFPLAIATSIDALAVGISFAFLSVNIFIASSLIGIITFIISGIGVVIGGFFGSKYKKVSEICGGIILVLIGVKILLEHLGVISF